MSSRVEHAAFMDALRLGAKCRCDRCGDGREDECRAFRLEQLHPADVWTIRELRKLSINGSFR